MSKKAYSIGIESLENKKLLSVVPNDPRIYDQWALNSMNIYGAWNYSTGSKDVVVAVIDSGIDLKNTDLKNNLWTNPGEIPGDGIDNEGDGYIDDIHGWNFYSNNNNIQDVYGHGTHVAGIIGAEGGNSWGVAGINWNVSLMTLKFTDDSGMGNTGTAAQAMDYISMMKNVYGVNVVVANASWGGGTGFSNILYAAINKLNDAGVVLTVAAGNSGSDNDITLRYPSCYDSNNIISVGALSSNGISLASYSNYGATTVDIAAPGGGILSTIPYNTVGYKSGTSMASPQVAGAVALLSAIKPGMSIGEIKNIIFSSADKIPELFGKVATNGKLNIEAAVCNILGIQYNADHAPDGAITNKTLKTVSGWASDYDYPNSPISVKLIIDGAEKDVGTTGFGGVWAFNLGGLTIGDHVIKIEAKNFQNDSWTTIGTTNVNIPAPVVRVGFLSQTRIAGWAFSERSGGSPVVVRVVINGKVVSAQWANLYRPALIPVVGSAYHGFNVSLNRLWFHRGSNEVKIQVFDPVSKQVSECWSGKVTK